MLKNAYHKRRKDTPEVSLEADTGILLFKGVCMPENPIKFFGQLNEWVCDYMKDPQPTTKLILDLEYINSVSMKYFYDLAVTMNKDSTNITIYWKHKPGDLMMIEKGVEFEYLTQMKVVIEESDE